MNLLRYYDIVTLNVLWQFPLGYSGYPFITIATLLSLVSPSIIDYYFVSQTKDLNPIIEDKEFADSTETAYPNYGLLLDIL